MMEPIVLNSYEYICWHEAGHVIAAYEIGATVEKVVVTKNHISDTTEAIVAKGGECKTSVDYSKIADSNLDKKLYVACGGWAAEYFLYRHGLILNLEKTRKTEKKFIDESNNNCSKDKIEYAGADYSINGRWPEDFDDTFMDFGIKVVYPILTKNEAKLRSLWQEILQKQTLTQEEIELIVLSNNEEEMMGKVLIPASDAEDWKVFLADPVKHWKMGYSARAVAHCWQDAGGIPSDVESVLSQIPALHGLQTIFAIPEHKVSLPGGTRPSQNDVWVLAETDDALVSIAVEGKVSESFDLTVGEWFENPSSGKEIRLKFLCNEIGIEFPPPNHIRYQLLHRTASAIIEAKRFRTTEAVMVVHSFSRTNEWLEDYLEFLSLYGLEGGVDQAASTQIEPNIHLHFAWVHGDEKYLNI